MGDNYGIRITDPETSNTLLLTPDIYSIVSSGRISMPDTLRGDGTYGVEIDLPGTPAYNESCIGVLLSSFILNVDVQLYILDDGGSYGISWYMHDTFTYYTRDEETGVLTEWVPDLSSPTAYDSILAIYPVAFWDKMRATEFTAVRLFAAMCWEIYDQSASVFRKVYSIGSEGVEQVDYMVALRNYTEI